jgi:heme-degrading monooxygenase HmoA
MATMFARATVQDYETWKAVFDSMSGLRRQYGEQSYRILQQENGSTELFVLFEWDNLENARRYATSSELREAMQRANFAEKPEFLFLEEADRG